MNRPSRTLTLATLVAVLPICLASAAAQEPVPKADGETRFEFRHRVPAPGGETQWQVHRSAVPRVFSAGPHSYLGIQVIDITPELRRHYGAPEEAGVLIGHVDPESPAAQAGLQVGDVLTLVDGEAVNGPMDVTHRVRSKEEGEPVTVTVWRDGDALDFSANLVQREVEGLHAMPALPRIQVRPRGQFQFHSDDGTVVDLQGLKDLPDFKWFSAEKMGEYFQSPEWEVALDQLHSGRGPLLERIDELEKRLADMEALLKKLDEK